MHSLYITSEDYEKLRRLLILAPFTSDRRRDLSLLRARLERAWIVPSLANYPSIIRLGSWFEYRNTHTSATGAYTLCMPHEASSLRDGLSIDTRLGAMIIGRRAGEEVRWVSSAGTVGLLIREVKQTQSECECETTTEALECVS